jgi:thiamine pyrophosphate-dependent acetolactate synthase large subunit-like protein
MMQTTAQALVDGLRQEAAAFAACAYAKFTGRLGVCMATSGPGGVHLVNGLYDAKGDDTPVLAITGHTWTRLIGTHYEQDVPLEDPAQAEAVLREALTEPGAALVECVVDPNEPPMPDKITTDQALGFAKTLAQGQPDRSKILREGVEATARELRDAPGTLF